MVVTPLTSSKNSLTYSMLVCCVYHNPSYKCNVHGRFVFTLLMLEPLLAQLNALQFGHTMILCGRSPQLLKLGFVRALLDLKPQPAANMAVSPQHPKKVSSEPVLRLYNSTPGQSAACLDGQDFFVVQKQSCALDKPLITISVYIHVCSQIRSMLFISPVNGLQGMHGHRHLQLVPSPLQPHNHVTNSDCIFRSVSAQKKFDGKLLFLQKQLIYALVVQ